ncbi:nucleotidyl transferase AbiEii/AbiGii toxin family protein [Nitrosomonas ureae]|uniref:Nucleotidyltransferase AbiEii toxin of type IV toxin-antitoxin system n=1 Tax=Nitrosomonas ureae TaxID=44577 RepID=A0A2T5IXV0_9PROT|nr:nucleotidyl transferase AbiEii/AbiGii toxin family protein [Nitrosomonas ureae]PTQ88797.1 nucleotidyltransferase AbiEii toxin of type IV toxin-antitoxin system [Nitrosomonas ureae]
MESVARLSSDQRRELFTETAGRKGMTPAIVEKDFWVCWTLSRLFAHPNLSRLLMFKGGTSLSKVFNLIERFSEDIDLILDWRVVVGDDDPLAVRSTTKQEKLNKTIDASAVNYIGGEMLAMISGAVNPICHCALATDDSHALNVIYPAAFSDTYLRPEVRLEIGPLAAWMPCDNFRIQSYAAEVFPKLFKQAYCAVQAIRAERTFWEKTTILHHEANRPEGNLQPPRYSRHYYDLAMMAASPLKDKALADFALLADVVAFKQRFYTRGWARYDQAKPGTFRLMPSGQVLATVQKDYKNMRNMIYGHYPAFDEIMAILQHLEGEINGSCRDDSIKISAPPFQN